MTRSSGLPGFNVQWPVLPSDAAVDAFGRDRVFGRAQGKARVVVEDFVFADEPKAAAECARSAGVGDQFEAAAPGWRIPIR